MATDDWLTTTLTELAQQNSAYQTRALLQQTALYAAELAQRIELSEGELDGRIWNHEQW